MTKMTSAYANKLIKKLEEDKTFWCDKEKNSYVYTAAADEEPLIPEYDYQTVAAEIDAIDNRIVKIKHAINLANTTNQITIDDKTYTPDMILVRMAQLNKRKFVLDNMRKQQPKTRIGSGAFSVRKTAPEYRYINYDLELIKSEYEKVDSEIGKMQIALDKYNQTVEFDVEE